MSVKMSAKDVKASANELEAEFLAHRNGGRKKPSWRTRRSEETRRSVMEATVQGLVNQGYANTTTQLVADTVGMSRGAMVHHYSTRNDIISGVIDFIFLRMLELAYEGVEKLSKKGKITQEDSVGLHWSVINSDEYMAYMELNIAARTDHELRHKFDPKAIAFDKLWLDRSMELFPHWNGDKERAKLAWNFARSTLEGLKINERILHKQIDRKIIRQQLIAMVNLMEKEIL